MVSANPLGVVRRAAHDARAAVSLTRGGVRAYVASGLTVPLGPLTLARISRDLLAFGLSPGFGYAGAADRHPGSPAVEEDGEPGPTFADAERITRAAAGFLAAEGCAPGSRVGLLGRNSLAFAVAVAAVGRTGADLFYLNTGFPAAQLADLVHHHGLHLVLADADLARRLPDDVPTVALPGLLAADSRPGVGPVVGGGRHIILTSGTTGRPKGADRSRTPLAAVVALLSSLPYRERGTHVMAAPMFHSWGWLNHRLTSLLDTTEVMVPHPTATAVLDAAERNRADLIITTPVVLGRLAAAGPGERNLSGLRGVLVSGSLLPPDVVARFQSQFGPVLYNLYGSTEVGYVSVASPDDLLAHPDTAGLPLPGVAVRILDRHGHPVAVGHEGEIWVGSPAAFSGYIDGGDTDRRDGLVATGDAGRLDADGFLFVHGRADDLIISGGENVHPAEVETVLRAMPEVADVAAVGTPDPLFGEQVVVHVVPSADTDPAELPDLVLAHARRELAPYQRPREVVVHTELPHSETGKVMRRLLGKPSESLFGDGFEDVEPGGPARGQD